MAPIQAFLKLFSGDDWREVVEETTTSEENTWTRFKDTKLQMNQPINDSCDSSILFNDNDVHEKQNPAFVDLFSETLFERLGSDIQTIGLNVWSPCCGQWESLATTELNYVCCCHDQ